MKDEAREESSSRRVRWLLVAIPSVLLGLGNVAWVATQHAAQPLDIDEAGYAAIALRDLSGLQSGGWSGWWAAVNAQPIQAPLAPALTSILHGTFGVHLTNQFLVSLAAYIGVVVLALAYTRAWPFLARAVSVAIVSCSPVLLLFSRTMNFAVLASVTLASALYFQQRSRGFTRWPGALLWGLSIGGMVLARTMTLAFLPALLCAALLACAQTGWPRRLARFGAGFAVSGLVAATWYATNWQGVWQYLTSYGYGSQANDYGSQRSLLSVSDWYVWLVEQVDRSVWAGVAFVASIGLALAVVVAVRVLAHDWMVRPDVRSACAAQVWRRVAASDATPPAVLSGLGLAALSTSTNLGTAFVAPLMFPIALTAGWGIERTARAVHRRGRVGRVVGSPATVLVTVLLLVVPAAALTYLPRSEVVTARLSLPMGRSLTLWDSRGLLRTYLDNDVPPPDNYDPGLLKYSIAWDEANAWLEAEMRRTATRPGQRPLLVFTDRHTLLNVNSLALRALLSGDTTSVITWIDPTVGSSDVDSLVAQTDRYRDDITAVVTMTPGPDEFAPAVPDAVGDRLVRELHLTLLATRTLPDGRVLKLWARP